MVSSGLAHGAPEHVCENRVRRSDSDEDGMRPPATRLSLLPQPVEGLPIELLDTLGLVVSV